MTINMLNAEQERENNRAVKLKEYLLQKKSQYSFYTPFNAEVQSLLGNIEKVNPLTPVKGKRGVVVTKQKKEIKAALAINVNQVCTSATAYAASISDKDLRYAVRFRTRDITNAKDGNITAIVTTITDALSPLLQVPEFKEYEITAGKLSALTTGAKAFSDTLGVASVINIRSSIANSNLNDVFTAIRGNIARLRLLLPYFYKSNPQFAQGFLLSAAVDQSGIRHSGIEGVIKSCHTGAPVQGVVIIGEGKKKTTKTDKDGIYKLPKLKVTNMKIMVTAPGYESQVIDIKIVRGKMIELNITLQTQVISLTATA